MDQPRSSVLINGDPVSAPSRRAAGPLGLGIIGCGWVTEEFHLPALRGVSAVSVVAAADEDPVRLQRVADRFGIGRRYSDHRTLLDDPAVDAVLVWLPADCQAEVAQSVLAAGKHLFLDKPLVFDLGIWDRMIAQAGEKNRHIMVVGFPRRSHPLIRQARGIVEEGGLGGIQCIRTVLTGRNAERRTIREVGPRHAVRGLLYEFGIHHFDVLQALVTQHVEEINAVSNADGTTIVVTARLSEGAMASFTFSEGESHNDEVEICGAAGRIRVCCYRFDGIEHVPSTMFPGDGRARAGQILESLRQAAPGLLRMRQGGNFIGSYRTGWRQCVDAIRNGARPDCTLVEARGALRLFLAAKASMEHRRPVILGRA